MEPVVTPAQMAEADRRTIAAGTPESELIARAAGALARRVRRRLGGTYGRRVVVVAGKGNNGNDGLVMARQLRLWGVGVDVFALADGIDTVRLERAVARADVVVDAMFGTGFRGALSGDAALVADRFARARHVVAVDIPSGVDGTDGSVAGPAVCAHETVCFAAWKSGLLLPPGRFLAGEVYVADIGIDVLDVGVAAWRFTGSDAHTNVWARADTAHKWTNAVLVIAGSRGMTGAAALSARAAQRAGSGMVVAAVPGVAAADRLSGTELVVRAVAAAADGSLAMEAVDGLIDTATRFRAAVLGPGIGAASEARAAVRRLVGELPVPLVLDADGLNALDGDLSIVRSRRDVTVLTPHDAEYGRLMGSRPGADRIGAARALADAAGCVALLKGPTTVVAAPGGEPFVVDCAGSELASAGTGDVLSGVIAAGLAHTDASGATADDAARAVATAAWVHGRAGARAGLGMGTVAGDVIDALPSTLLAISTRPAPTIEPHS